MNGTSWNFNDSYARKQRFWLYLSFVLLALGFVLGLLPDNRFVQLASLVSLVTASGSILTWVSYAAARPMPRLIMSLTLFAEAVAFSLGIVQALLLHELSNFVWG